MKSAFSSDLWLQARVSKSESLFGLTLCILVAPILTWLLWAAPDTSLWIKAAIVILALACYAGIWQFVERWRHPPLVLEVNSEGIISYQTRLGPGGQEVGSRGQFIRWRAIERIENEDIQIELDEGSVLVHCAVIHLRKSSHAADTPEDLRAFAPKLTFDPPTALYINGTTDFGTPPELVAELERLRAGITAIRRHL